MGQRGIAQGKGDGTKAWKTWAGYSRWTGVVNKKRKIG